MATEYSIQKMVSDGTLSTIALGIQYLQRNDIYMRIAGEETPQSGAPSGYTWAFLNNTTLRILPVVPNGVEVVIYRRTDIDAMYNIYSQNAQFDESTIDENNQQLLYIAQEYLEQGIPGAGVAALEYVNSAVGINYYRFKLTDGSYTPIFGVPDGTDVLRSDLNSSSGASQVRTESGTTLQATVNTLFGSEVYLDSYESLAIGGDWTAALQAALDTGRPVKPNPARNYTVSGIVQSKGNSIVGKFNITPTRSAISGLGTFTFDPDAAKSDVKNNIKLLYCLHVYDLIELLYIRSMGFNMIFHGGHLNTERPDVDTISALNLMLDNASTAQLKVNMSTGHILNEDSMAIGYVTIFRDHPAVWGFSVFDEPSFHGISVARQTERLAALRQLTFKNLNVTDVIQNYAPFRNGYNPWAHGYDTFFVDAYSHTLSGDEAENIAADLRDMRTAVGVAATHLPEANVVPMCGLFKHTGFTTSINQIKATAPVLAKCAGGDFAAFAWDAVEDGLTSNVLTGLDLRDLARSLCTMAVNGKRIPTAYKIGGASSNPESRPPVAVVGADLMKKRDYATAFIGSGTAFGVLKNGADGEFTSPLIASGQSIGGLWFRGQFPVAVTDIPVKRNISMPLAFIDVTGAKSGALTIHYSNDEGGSASSAAISYPFVFTAGIHSVNLNLDIVSGDYWRGYKLVFAQSVNPPVDATNYRCGLHGFVVVSDW